MTATGADPLEERILARIPWEIAACAAVLAAGAFFLFNPSTGLFVMAGGAVSAAGFVGMKSGLSRVLLKPKSRALRSGLGLFGLRLVLLLLIFSFIILTYPGRLPAFVAGFSTVVPVFLMEAVRAISRTRAWKR
jgi:hypothetical protein